MNLFASSHTHTLSSPLSIYLIIFLTNSHSPPLTLSSPPPPTPLLSVSLSLSSRPPLEPTGSEERERQQRELVRNLSLKGNAQKQVSIIE